MSSTTSDAPQTDAQLSVGATISVLRGHLRPYRTAVAVGCLLLVCSGGLSLLQPLAAKLVLDALGRGQGISTALGVLTALVVAGALALGFGSFLLLRSAEGVVLGGRRMLVAHILRLSVTGMRAQKPGDLLSRVTADMTLLRQIAIQSLVQAIVGVVMLVGALVLMAIVDLVLFATTALVILALAAVAALVLPRVREASRLTQQSVGMLGSDLERVLGAFTTVKASGAEPLEMHRVGSAAHHAYAQGIVMARWNSIAGTTSGLAIQVAFLVVLGIGGARVANGAISPSTLVAFLLYVLYLTQPILQLVSASTFFQAGRAAVTRIREITQLATEPVATAVPHSSVDGRSPEHAPSSEGEVSFATDAPASLTFERVGFAYPGRARAALIDFSLEVPATGITALVGPSGAGKTTVLSLIERFFDPDVGRVLLDGRDLRAWDLVELRSEIAYVEQDAPVMAGTLRDNLVYAAPDASDAEMHAALRVSRLEYLLERLGGDLSAEIQYRGSSLSGGERQRIAIARALLRRPRLLILDEATSDLDAVSEAGLRDVVEQLSETTTVVIVAHRLSTVQAAQRIAVMEDGRLRCVGRHDELIREDGLYAELAASQELA